MWPIGSDVVFDTKGSFMNTCGICRHLGREFLNYEGDIPVGSGIYVCDLIEFDEGEEYGVKRKRAIAAVIDGSGYFAALCVREDFGCNQWKAK
jgi:hypothetical protein